MVVIHTQCGKMGIKNMDCNRVMDISTKKCQKTVVTMDMWQSDTFDLLNTFIEEDLYASVSDVILMTELPTPPLSPRQGDDDGEFDIDAYVRSYQPFDVDTDDLLLFDAECEADVFKEVGICFPDSPHEKADLQSNLIQDIMWSAPTLINGKASASNGQRVRCNSCSDPFKTACVAPDEVFPTDTTNIGDSRSESRVHNLGIETPSDSEEEIDVVTVHTAEKQLHIRVVSNIKTEYSSDDSGNESSQTCKSQTGKVINNKTNILTHRVDKCAMVRQRVDCPTDVHNYSLPVTSLKRLHSYSNSPSNHKIKKFKRDISVPSDLRKVAQKLKSSAGSYSQNSSDSEEFCDGGKRTQHNVLERKRRTDLKNNFFHLRDSVPELKGQVRAPKVVILKKACYFIIKLTEEHKKQEKELELLKIRKEKLKRQLAKLKE